MRTPSARVTVALAALATWATGCERLQPIGNGTQVRCASSAECPEGWFCQTSIELCVENGHAGELPRVEVGSVRLDPPIASRDSHVTVTFTSSTALGSDPVVALVAGSRRALALVSREGLVYTYAGIVPADVPDGTYPLLASLVSRTGAEALDQPLENLVVDSTPPDVARVDTLTPTVAAGATAALEVTFGEALTEPPAATVVGVGPMQATRVQPQVWRVSWVATGAEPEGQATVELRAHDDAGNVVDRTVDGAFTFDFTPPALSGAVEVGTARVRPGQQAVVSFTATETLDGAPVVTMVGRASARTLPLALAEHVGLAWTFGRRIEATDPEDVYDVHVASIVDLAGNPGADAPGGTITLDATPPAVVAPGPALSKTSGQYRAGETVGLTFTVSEDLSGPPLIRLTTTPERAFTCEPGTGARAWACATTALTGAELPESAVNAVIALTDLAGNVGSASATVVLDFHGPSIVAGSVGLSLIPPPGSLVSTVTRLGPGGRARITFSTDEPLAVSPQVATSSPESLALAQVSAAATTYVYELALPAGAHAQGVYTVQATLTDHAGNVTRPALSLPAPDLVVDTIPPLSPDVQTAGKIVYARVPWGTATGGRSSYTVTGGTGAAEASATLVAFDGADPASANEIGRTAASATGSFTLALAGGDRRQVWVLAVDGAGAASDGDPAAAGAQAVSVRDVTWTATLGGKVLGSTIENPHVLQARPRFMGPLEQGASDEDVLPSSTRGTLAWIERTPASWPAAPGTLVEDPARGRLVAFVRSGDADGVWEFDGSEWRASPATGGPKLVYAAAWHAGLREVVVYADPCTGGTVLWSWNGARWKALATGASYGAWGAGGVPGPGPHAGAHLTFAEQTGDLVLTYGPYRNLVSIYPCGDASGGTDREPWAWGTSGWRSLAGPVISAAGPAAYAPGRGVVSYVTGELSGGIPVVQEWNGTAWNRVVPTDPESDGNPGSSGSHMVFDGDSGSLMNDVGGALWGWNGTSWRSLGAALGGAIATSPSRGRAVSLAPTELAARSGGTWTIVAAPAPTVAVAGLVRRPSATKLERLDVNGGVRAWSGGAWLPVTVADPELDGNPAALSSVAWDATRGYALACGSSGCWAWNGASFRSLNATGATTPLVSYPGLGVVTWAFNAAVSTWDGAAFTSAGSGTMTPYGNNGNYSTALGGLAMGAHWDPYGADDRLYTWASGGTWQQLFNVPGYGRLWPLPPDGFGRTFVLHGAGQLYQAVAGATPVLQPVRVDDPTGSGAPPDWTATGAAWNAADQALYVASGLGTYRLQAESGARPGHLFRIAYPASGGPDTGGCLGLATSCDISRVDVTWAGIATAQEGVAGTSATLSAWDGVTWLTLGTVTAGAGVQARSSVAVTSPNAIGRLGNNPAHELAVALRTNGSSTQTPLLRSDEFSLKVTYRLR